MSTPSPSLEQLKKTARDLLRAFQSDNPLARKRVAGYIPRLARSGTELRLAEAQFVVARENGYPSWPKLKTAIEVGITGELSGLSGSPSTWRRTLVHDAAREAAECAETRDVEGLLRALSFLGRRAGDTVRGLLVEQGTYPAVVETLIVGLESAQPRRRFECADMMDHFADERCVEPLRCLLDDPVPRVRRAALHSLSCDACKLAPLGTTIDFVALLIERAFADPSVQVRRHAVSELAVRRADPRAAAALIRLYEEESDPSIRRTIGREMDRGST